MNKNLLAGIIAICTISVAGVPTNTYAQKAFKTQSMGNEIASSDDNDQDSNAGSTKGDDDKGKKECNKGEKCCHKYDYSRPSFSLTGTVYGGLPYIQDDNPKGFAQTFLQANINRRHKKTPDRIGYFRNFFLQGYFSSNVGSLNTYIKDTGSNAIRYTNRLDLYQYASSNVKMHQNLFFYNSKPGIYNASWKTLVFFDVMESFMRTNVTDSLTQATTNINSVLLGTSLTLQVYNNKNEFGLPMSLRISAEMFWINPLTNTVNSDLNFQYANRSDINNALNVGKKDKYTSTPYPYLNLDAQILFQVSKADAKNVDVPNSDINKDSIISKKTPLNEKEYKAKNYVFLHVGYVSNIYNTSSSVFNNNYLTAQIGMSIDIVNTIKKYGRDRIED